ncbi:hypothetical protein DJ031_05935 [bacterium endosymbiont of Escarpia laminata]|nr:MAG: hypothetical protein DJ031_05935 [bacterium endosymbiont of Escarpia laminata]
MKKRSKKKLKKRLRKARKKALHQQMSAAEISQEAKDRPVEELPALELTEQELSPVLEGHDESALARAKTHWFFGEWHQLAALDMDSLHAHPDRDRFALLIASAHQQLGHHDKARKYTRMALDFGCLPRVVAQVLIAGVHNTLGRAAALKQDESRIAHHFEASVAAIGTRDSALLSQARSVREMARMGLLPQAASLVDHQLPATNEKKRRLHDQEEHYKELKAEVELLNHEIELTRQDSQSFHASSQGIKANRCQSMRSLEDEKTTFVPGGDVEDQGQSYIFKLRVVLDGANLSVRMNSSHPEYFEIDGNKLKYSVPDNESIYLVSNENGDFNKVPINNQINLVPDSAHEVSGVISHRGVARPFVWLFEYDAKEKIASKSVNIKDGAFRIIHRTNNALSSFCIGIRLVGEGMIDINPSFIDLKSGLLPTLTESMKTEVGQLDDLLVRVQKHLERVQKKEISNSTKQIEYFMRLQHYLGPAILIPEVHNWSISPDFGLLIINRVEENDYDAVIEFGSGTSTLFLAKAVQNVGQRNKCPASPMLSFDHLEKYHTITQGYLARAGLEHMVNLVLAPLVHYTGPDNEGYRYYDCESSLRQLMSSLPNKPPKILVIVDGPPAATGKHARFPALPILLDICAGAVFDFIMDDYIRDEEKTIVVEWMELLALQNISGEKIEFTTLEKQACLIAIDSSNSRKK